MAPHPSSSRQRLPRYSRALAGVLYAPVIAVAGCSSEGRGPGSGDGDATVLSAEIVAAYPSDPSSFIQGLEVMPEGDLLVSTGLEGHSRIYRTPLGSVASTVSAELAPELFGEGSTRHGDTIWQLTWTDGVVIQRDAATLTETGQVNYEGEGWGLCSNGERLVMSDGSSELVFRDPVTFAETGRVGVTLNGSPVDQLNELDCSDGVVWANLWRSDRIVRINPATGRVTGTLDTGDLDMAARDADGADVLNGIARVPGSTDRYLITGKLWDTIYEVRIQ